MRIDAEVSVLFSEPKIPQSTSIISVANTINKFQCSSASRKFLNGGDGRIRHQKARFQCSSASRKFLNEGMIPPATARARFSALQRAENSSIGLGRALCVLPHRFQCSSASRKFLNVAGRSERSGGGVRFSALQRAENSSMWCAG